MSIRERVPRNQHEESVSPALTPLDRTHDNFEALLLKLLQAYTMQSSQPSENASGSASSSANISGEALDTLSPAQISALITSNSVNYEVIQQILAQHNLHSAHQSSPSPNTGGGNSPSYPENSSGEVEPESMETTHTEPAAAEMASLESDIMEHTSSAAIQSLEIPQNEDVAEAFDGQIHREASSSSSEHSPHSPNSPVVISSSGSGSSTPAGVIHITMDQLALLQNQVQGLLQAQNVSLPSGVSPDLIQSLILRQLGGAASTLLKDSASANLAPDLSVLGGSSVSKPGPVQVVDDTSNGKRQPSNFGSLTDSGAKANVTTDPSSAAVKGTSGVSGSLVAGGYAPSNLVKGGVAAVKARGRGGSVGVKAQSKVRNGRSGMGEGLVNTE